MASSLMAAAPRSLGVARRRHDRLSYATATARQGHRRRIAEYSNGFIVTPIAILYRLKMDCRDRGKLPAHLQKRLWLLDEKQPSAFLDVTLPELRDALALPQEARRKRQAPASA
jgi:hypothetical protein